MIHTYKFLLEREKDKIDAIAVICGSDVIIIVGGGSRPHIGSVAVATSHPSLRDSATRTATASVISIQGHKEDLITRTAALKLAKALHTTVVVSAGIHIDNATPDQIDDLVDSFNQLINEVEAKLIDVLDRF